MKSVEKVMRFFVVSFAAMMFISMFLSASASATVVTRTYTVDADFEQGILFNVEHDTVHDQLQMSKKLAALPFIWVPNNQGTVSKVSTETGNELGRYHVAPSYLPGGGNPSRTTVDLSGNCWVGNRQAGTVVKIGLLENNQCVDRNGNGAVETSLDVNGDGNISDDELLPWGEDECVSFEIVLIPGYIGAYAPGTYTGPYDWDYWGVAPRGLAIDAKNNLWAGTWSTQKYHYINGDTGEILRTIDVSPWGFSSYGATIDRNGVLWSTSVYSGQILRMDPSTDPATISVLYVPPAPLSYGLGLDYSDHLFVTSLGSQVTRINTLTGTVDWTKNMPGLYGGKGIACTSDNNIWITDTYANTVVRYDNDGNLLATIPVGWSPSGAAVDAAGKVWVTDNGDDNIYRIDPATNSVDLSKAVIGSWGHYTYSDMTGMVSRTITAASTWTVVFDSGTANTPWGRISWNSYEPSGTSITVKARSSNDLSVWSSWEPAANGVSLSAAPNGRYLQIEATLQINTGEISPVLYDLTVTTAITAAIDIKPGSYPNSINIDSEGMIPVAVLTTDDFDAATVDPTTVFFGAAKPLRYSLKDVDGDGDADLILHFKTKETGIKLGDTEMTLKGLTRDGQKIWGVDSVRVLENNANIPVKPVRTTSLRHNVGISDCDVAAVSGNIIAISMDERDDQKDYNGDGDTGDRVLGYYDIHHRQLTNTGISIGNSVSIDGDLIVFEIPEGDGWWGNRTLGYYSIRQGRLYNTGITATSFGRHHWGPTRVVSSGKIVYNNENYELCIYDTASRTSSCTGVVGYDPAISGSIIAFNVEWWYGVVAYYDLTTGSVTQTGIAGQHPVVDNGYIAFESSEGVGYYDIAAGKYAETPLTRAYSVSISNGVISALVDEWAWGVDLSGDGDTDDNYMVVAYDIRADKVINTGVQGCCGTDISNGVIIFDTYEGDHDIRTDFNGDGDMGDCVQQYVVLKEVLMNKVPGSGQNQGNKGTEQWAATAIASSEWDPTYWAAWQATGEPNTFACGDIETAWAPLSSGPDPEWIELGFSTPVRANGLRVHETYMSGFIYQVDLIDTDGAYHTIWSGTDTTTCPGWFEISFERTKYLVKGVKLYTQTDGWEEVDAVALISRP